MSKFLVTLRFDGTKYCGWQVQQNGVTIQETVQNAIEAVTGIRSDLSGCSRTDSGVHAGMYCCSFETEYNITAFKTIKALNAHLPRDIVAYDCEKVSDNFHPRYMATAKEYYYRILNESNDNPFFDNFSYKFIKKLNISNMRAACTHLVGTHDFSAFCNFSACEADNVRTIFVCEVEFEKSAFSNNVILFKIKGDGFLYNMVRIIVGTLISVGVGKISPQDVVDILMSKDRSSAGVTAPAKGLILQKVEYNI